MADAYLAAGVDQQAEPIRPELEVVPADPKETAAPTPTIHEEMLASVARTAFTGINSPRIPLVSREALEAGNQRVIEKVGLEKARRLLIVGPDAVIFGDEATQLTNKHVAELLGFMILKREKFSASQYFQAGLFSESIVENRGPQFSRSVRYLVDEISDRNQQPIVTRTGHTRSSKAGVDDVLVKDLRHSNAYHQARQRQMQDIVQTYILSGDLRPDISERGGIRGAQTALRQAASKDLEDEQLDRFVSIQQQVAESLDDRTQRYEEEYPLRVHHGPGAEIREAVLAGFEPEWQTRALCRGPLQRLFFPPPTFERKYEKLEREARAKAICRDCPVRQECLDAAIARRERHGVWGGRAENELKALF